MAQAAGVGDFVLIRHTWGDEAERMRVNFHVRDFRLDRGHMARHAITARGNGLYDACELRGSPLEVRSIPRHMAVEANRVCRFPQFGVVPLPWTSWQLHRSRRAVHPALHEIVALHAVLVRSAVGEMSEGRLAQLVLFQPPHVLQILPASKPTGQS